MANNNKTRITGYTAQERREAFLRAWQEFAAEDRFAESTLAEFEAESLAVETVRDEIAKTRSKLAGLRRQRDAVDDAFRALAKRVSMGVQAHPSHGPDSPIFRALGYVAESDRASGLTRKSSAMSPTPPTEDAA